MEKVFEKLITNESATPRWSLSLCYKNISGYSIAKKV